MTLFLNKKNISKKSLTTFNQKMRRCRQSDINEKFKSKKNVYSKKPDNKHISVKIYVCYGCATSSNVCKHHKLLCIDKQHWDFLKRKYIFKFLLVWHLKKIVKELRKNGNF